MISVIIPVHNSESTLELCVESVLNNSYRNIEVILVENASTDSSLSLCYAIAQRDLRVQVIHTDLKGLSNARNLGIERAQGDWLAFVDSDDYVSPYLYESLLKAANRENADFVFCNYYMGSDSCYRFPEVNGLPCTTIGLDQFYHDTYMRAQYKYSVVWNKLISNKLVTAVRFNTAPNMWIEDRNFVIRVVCKANRIVSLDLPLYYYFRGDAGSISNSSSSKTRMGQVYSTQQDLAFFVTSSQV